ncbi:MAG TPA: STAS domain-containing protein [Acidimicrobiia bacterium]|nr:STAS domain-containing protein [Acidimicrobiia bacterium]
MEHAGLTIERRPSSSSLCVRGELDVSTVGTLEVVLVAELDTSASGVDLDLSGLEFMGVVGVDMLTRVAHRGAARGRPLRLVATNRLVDRAVDLVCGERGLGATPAERLMLIRGRDIGSGGCGRVTRAAVPTVAVTAPCRA